jgi:hypothetical protein
MWGTSIVGFEDRHKKLLAKLGPRKTGKGCLYLKSLADIDLDVLRELMHRSVRVRRAVDRAQREPRGAAGLSSGGRA